MGISKPKPRVRRQGDTFKQVMPRPIDKRHAKPKATTPKKKGVSRSYDPWTCHKNADQKGAEERMGRSLGRSDRCICVGETDLVVFVIKGILRLDRTIFAERSYCTLTLSPGTAVFRRAL